MSPGTHDGAIATIGDVGGRSVVLAYGSVAAEYEALHTRAALFDRSHRGRLRVRGGRAAEMVNGLVTNDVAALAPGQGCYAAALSAKGKIVADVRVFVEDDSVLVDVPARAASALAAVLKKFVNPRIAPHVDETAALRDIGIFGADARHVTSVITGIPAPALTALPPYAHVTVSLDGAITLVVKSPDLGVEGFELIAPADRFDALWERTALAGAVPAGLDVWELARIEAGRPEWGLDMDDSTIPQEANFDELHAISYTKGCYVGQETVARIHFRGHVNRHLRGLRSPGEEPLPRGATLHDESGTPVGDVRSSARSPALGAIALAMVRREVAIGASAVVRWSGGEGSEPHERRAVVAALPFAGEE
ncbi:MAG: folate-binding protein YgfZ [Gemmatimonadaceae bacterium]|nr:folate-binding protein YgfZ [Gemmatimonadaceae bacterium]